MLARCFTIDSRITAWSGGTMIMTHPGVRQGRDTSPSRSHSHRRGCCSDSRRWPGRPPAGVACTACPPPVVLPAVGDTLGLSINTTWSAQWPHSSPRLSTSNAAAHPCHGPVEVDPRRADTHDTGDRAAPRQLGFPCVRIPASSAAFTIGYYITPERCGTLGVRQ